VESGGGQCAAANPHAGLPAPLRVRLFVVGRQGSLRSDGRCISW